MTKSKRNTTGVHILTSELSKIKEWLDGDLMMTARSVKIIVENVTGIGQSIQSIAYDDDGQQIAKKDVTDYEAW
ncbi:hypothetical protein EB001_03680 [bacterium]|nr:hypothetical protein [bacterium]